MSKWQEVFEKFKTDNIPDSIKAIQLRDHSFAQFLKEGLPTKKEEAWKYTSLEEFQNKVWLMPDTAENQLTHDQMQILSKKLPAEFNNLVFVNGTLDRTLSDDLASHVEISELVEQDFNEISDYYATKKLKNLSDSFLKKVIKIKLRAGQTVTEPFHILWVHSSKSAIYSSEKIQIEMPENSELQVLAHTFSFANGEGDSHNINISANVAKNARLKLVQLQNEDVNSFHFSQTSVITGDGANVSVLTLSLGNQLIRNDLSVHFRGVGAEAKILGLNLENKKQHIDNYTQILHEIGGNNSLQHYKSVLADESHSVFRGRVVISPNAQKANSEQLHNALLISAKAKNDSVPQLEIFADDVKAAHGATVGRLNDEEIFYFLSRGISKDVAERLLALGFAQEIIFKFESGQLENYLQKMVLEKLNSLVGNYV